MIAFRITMCSSVRCRRSRARRSGRHRGSPSVTLIIVRVPAGTLLFKSFVVTQARRVFWKLCSLTRHVNLQFYGGSIQKKARRHGQALGRVFPRLFYDHFSRISREESFERLLDLRDRKAMGNDLSEIVAMQSEARQISRQFIETEVFAADKRRFPLNEVLGYRERK